MTAETIAMALGGRKAGGGWVARCPAHDDRTPSLSIRNGDNKVLVRCHAGCDQERVIAALRDRGVWEMTGKWEGRFAGKHQHRTPEGPDPDDLKRTNVALNIWAASGAVKETPAEIYLRARGLNLPVTRALRFHPGMKHPSGGVWPAMVALVTRGDTGCPIAIHRTFLARDGQAKAPVDPEKMMLGPCRGGVVRLGEVRDVLMVGEGIETCLSAMQATGNPAWAALSTSGLRALDLPRHALNVIVLADGDERGEAAAQECARRWKREGRCVRIARPPNGMDFNDLLNARPTFFQEAGQ